VTFRVRGGLHQPAWHLTRHTYWRIFNVVIRCPEQILDYATTKAAIVGFTKGLSTMLCEKHGIRVNAVAPGPIWCGVTVGWVRAVHSLWQPSAERALVGSIFSQS